MQAATVSSINGPDDLLAERGDDAMAEVFTESVPVITVKPGEMPKAVDKAEEVLLTHSELRIFQRSGEVVMAVQLSESKHSSGLRQETGTLLLVPLRQVALTDMLDRLIIWQRIHTGRDGTEAAVRIDCPGKIAVTYLSRIGSWRLPLLV